jgi:hypothetical protein
MCDTGVFCDSSKPYCIASKDAASVCFEQSVDSTFQKTNANAFRDIKVMLAALISLFLLPFLGMCFVAACCRRRKKKKRARALKSTVYENPLRKSFPGLFSRDKLKHKNSTGSKTDHAPPVAIEMTRFEPSASQKVSKLNSAAAQSGDVDVVDVVVDVKPASSTDADIENQPRTPEYMAQPDAVFYSVFGKTWSGTSSPDSCVVQNLDSYIGLQFSLPTGFAGKMNTSLDLQDLILEREVLKQDVLLNLKRGEFVFEYRKARTH